MAGRSLQLLVLPDTYSSISVIRPVPSGNAFSEHSRCCFLSLVDHVSLEYCS